MWILSETGFVSEVREHDNLAVLTVSSRDREPLEALAATTGAEIAQSPQGDYPYRAFVKPEVFAQWVSVVAAEIDYDNFKGRIAHTKGYDCAHTLGSVWSVMLDTEDSDARVQHYS